MKKTILLLIVTLVGLMSCETPGTSYNADKGNHSKYNIEKYYYDSDSYIIIATRKDSLAVQNVSWRVQQGKTTRNQSAVIDENGKPEKEITVYQYQKNQILMENDSIVIIRK